MTAEARYDLRRIDWKRVRVAVRGELAEDFHGRSMLTLIFGCGVFSLAVNGLYSQLASFFAGMASQGGAGTGPVGLSDGALSGMLSSFGGTGTSELLLQMGPRSMLYGYCSLLLVQVLALLQTPAVIAQDVATGATRFLLVRINRPTYWAAKWCAMALRLGLGLGVGLLVAVGLSAVAEPAGALSDAWWLTVVSVWAWVYGLSFGGVFMAVSLLFRRPGKARLAAFLLYCAAWYAYFWGASSGMPELALVVLPQSHVGALWGPTEGRWLGLVGLALIAVLPPVAAGLVFQRRDA